MFGSYEFKNENASKMKQNHEKAKLYIIINYFLKEVYGDMTWPGEQGLIRPEQVVRGRRRLGEENVGTNHGCFSLALSLKIKMECPDKQNKC